MTKQFTHTWEEAVFWLKSQVANKEIIQACYYDDPLVDAAERFLASEEWAEVKNVVSEKLPGKVLDLGAGRGISSYAFAKAGCDVTSIEPNPSDRVGAGSIENLSMVSGLKIEVVKEYGETLPFDNETFDIVYGRAVMHHALELPRFCLEATRVLKHGGIFIGTREHVISKKEDLQIFLDDHLLHHLYGGENAYLLNEYLTAITGSGLSLRQVFAPYDSAINYGPQTTKEFYEKFGERLSKYVGFAGPILAGNSFVRKALSWHGANVLSLPGRLYSFVAVKQ
jgi:SAM-dependent methyltransferase